MYDGQITAMDADNAYVGAIASQSFDFGFSMVPNDYKCKDSHPDFHVEAQPTWALHPYRIGVESNQPARQCLFADGAQC